MVYEQADADKSSYAFNMINYEDEFVDTESNDPNERICRSNLNVLIAHFLLNDTEVELTQRITTLFAKINRKWPFMVNRQLISSSK